jgi:hypothetical protein
MGLFRKKAAYDRTHFLRQVREQVRQKKYKRALPLLRQLVAREPRNPELHPHDAYPPATRRLDYPNPGARLPRSRYCRPL